MSAELAKVSFRTESGVAEDESWTVVDSAVLPGMTGTGITPRRQKQPGLSS